MFLREQEYDPFTGITKKWYFDGDKLVYHKEFDEKFIVDHTKNLANSTIDASFINSKKRFHKMASIPPIIYEEILKKHGVDMLKSNMSAAEKKKLYRIIETEYPLLKTHTKKLWRPVSGAKQLQ